MKAIDSRIIPPDIDFLIEQRFSKLSPRLQQAARYIIDNAQQVALSSMRTTAACANVDPSTMVRLAQELGFAGYQDLRSLFRDKMIASDGAWAGRARRIQTRSDTSSGLLLVREILEQDQANLDRTFSSENMAALERATQLMKNSRAAFVVGLRSLYPIAFYFHYACRLFNANTILLTGTGGTFADDLRLAQRDDVMLVFSYRPYARETVRAVNFLKGQGGKIIAVTDSKVSPIAKAAEIVIIVSNSSTSLLPTVMPFFAIAQALATLMVSEGSKEAIQKIARSEEQLQSFRVYHDATKLK